MDERFLELFACCEDPGSSRLIRDPLLEAVRLLSREPDLVRGIWHPLGFMHLRLASRGDTRLRLHVWPCVLPEIESLGWFIHSHDWMLRSYVLCGVISNQLYALDWGSDHPTHRLYEVEDVGLLNQLRATPWSVECKLQGEERMERGHDYTLAADVFHSSSVAPGRLTATLVLARDVTPKVQELVLGSLDGAPVYRLTRRACAPEEIRSAMLAVLQESEGH